MFSLWSVDVDYLTCRTRSVFVLNVFLQSLHLKGFFAGPILRRNKFIILTSPQEYLYNQEKQTVLSILQTNDKFTYVQRPVKGMH